MIGATPILHGLGSGGGSVRLVGGGALGLGVAFVRASTALATAADGVTWQTAAADTPRFHGTARRLLVEGGRTNSIRNPRGQGSVAGTPGTMPTNWAWQSLPAGLSSQVVGAFTVAGLPAVRLRLFGTPSAAGFATLAYESNSALAAAPGQSWAHSVGLALAGGDLANVTLWRLIFNQRDASGSALDGGSTLDLEPPGALPVMYSQVVTTANASTGRVGGRLLVSVNAAPVDVTFDVLCPQLELSAFASSRILPPAGTIAASTRAVEVPVYVLSAAERVRGTLVGSFLLPQLPPTGSVGAGIFQLDDGTTNGPRLTLRVLPTGNVRLVNVGATTAINLSLGNCAAGTPARFAVSYGPEGVSACLNGGAVAASTGAVVPSSISALVIGHSSRAYDLPANGEIGPLDLHPTRLPDSTLQALTTL